MIGQARRQERRRLGFFGFLIAALFTLVSALFLVAPGMVVVAAARTQLGQPLDPPVMWACAALVSFVLFAIVWWRTSNARKDTQAPRLVVAARVYFGACLLTAGALALGHWVFKVQFPSSMVGYYASGERAEAVYAWLGVERPSLPTATP